MRRDLLRSLVDALVRTDGCTVLLSTHLLADVERLATHVGILDRGRIVGAGAVEDWQRTMRRVQVVFPGGEVPAGLEVPGTLRGERLGPVLTAIARVTDESQLDGLKALSGVRVNVFPLTLEELFVEWFEPGGQGGPMSGPGSSGPFEIWGRPGSLAVEIPDNRVGNGVSSAIGPAGRDADGIGTEPAPYVEMVDPRVYWNQVGAPRCPGEQPPQQS